MNHPKTIPTPSSPWKYCLFHENSPWCQKGWGLLIYSVWMLKKSATNTLAYVSRGHVHPFLLDIYLEMEQLHNRVDVGFFKVCG